MLFGLRALQIDDYPVMACLDMENTGLFRSASEVYENGWMAYFLSQNTG